MEFDFDIARLAKLSGIKESKNDSASETDGIVGESDMLNENTNPKTKQALAEAKVREIIRKEIASIVAEMAGKQDGDTSWMYGKGNKPNGSKDGKISMGMFGPGFKK